MKKYIAYFVLLALAGGLSQACTNTAKEGPAIVEESPRILVFTKTGGYYHESLPAATSALQKLGDENGVLVDTTKNAAYFTADSLKRYKAVVFLSTTGEVLNDAQQEAFEQYIKAGGGFAGVHSATDTEYEWPWYNKLVGAYFASHPEVQTAAIDVVDHTHPATNALPERWERADEWYNFKSMNPDVQVLATLDEQTYKGGENGANHPIAWYHTYDGGRAFYTALGHTEESYSDTLFLKHLWGGITYALGEEAGGD